MRFLALTLMLVALQCAPSSATEIVVPTDPSVTFDAFHDTWVGNTFGFSPFLDGTFTLNEFAYWLTAPSIGEAIRVRTAVSTVPSDTIENLYFGDWQTIEADGATHEIIGTPNLTIGPQSALWMYLMLDFNPLSDYADPATHWSMPETSDSQFFDTRFNPSHPPVDATLFPIVAQREFVADEDFDVYHSGRVSGLQYDRDLAMRVTVTPVPEPSVPLLLGLGCVMALTRTWRRRQPSLA
jgi:hypothetical protein